MKANVNNIIEQIQGKFGTPPMCIFLTSSLANGAEIEAHDEDYVVIVDGNIQGKYMKIDGNCFFVISLYDLEQDINFKTQPRKCMFDYMAYWLALEHPSQNIVYGSLPMFVINTRKQKSNLLQAAAMEIDNYYQNIEKWSYWPILIYYAIENGTTFLSKKELETVKKAHDKDISVEFVAEIRNKIAILIQRFKGELKDEKD